MIDGFKFNERKQIEEAYQKMYSVSESSSEQAGFDAEAAKVKISSMSLPYDAWVEGSGDDWAVFYLYPTYSSPVDSNGYEFDDDGDLERYEANKRKYSEMIYDALFDGDTNIGSIGFEDAVVMSPVDEYGRPTRYSYGNYSKHRISPKNSLDRARRRYVASETSRLYDRARRIANTHANKSQKERALDSIYDKVQDIEDRYLRYGNPRRLGRLWRE